MRTRKVFFTNHSGDKLSGLLDFPLSQKPKAYALFAHCFTCSKDLKAVSNISRGLTDHNIAVLRFDFTGLGQSQGDFAKTGFGSNLMDLLAAYNYLKAEHGHPPQLLIGHSLGGSAALHVAHRMPAVRAVVSIGAPFEPSHVQHLLGDKIQELKDKGQVEVSIGERPFVLGRQFLEDLEASTAREDIHNLNKALLVLHSPQDAVVPITNATEIYQAAMHPKSFVTLDGADHLLSKAADSYYAGSIISAWAERYLDLSGWECSEAPEGEVWTRIGGEGFYTEVTAGQHHLMADEPKGSGGSDLGPSPYGYLLAALGACTAMTLRMYADHKKLPVKEVEVTLTHDKVHIEDNKYVEESKGKIDHIKRLVRIEGELTETQRARLLEIADRCPVHKTLEGKPVIETDWA